MGGDDFAGLSTDQQLVLIACVGIALVVAGYATSSTVDPNYDPLLVGIGAVCVGYAALRFGYELIT